MNLVEEQILETLAKSLVEIGSKAVPSGTPSTPYVQGPGGSFGVSGLEQTVIATRVQPQGLISVLPAMGSIRTNPLYPFITGFQPTTGTAKDGVCDDPIVAGAMKTCIQTTQFGRQEFSTRELEVNRVGQQTDRGNFLDLQLLNDPLVNQMAGIMQQNFALDKQGSVLAGNDMVARFIEVGVAFQDLLGRQLYTGDPANNSAGGGTKEFPGLDIIIGTNKVDAITGDDCPSLDSDIKDFNYDIVDDVNAANNIVDVLTYLTRTVRHNASTMNFGATTWTFVMREGAFYEISAVWPCNYQTYRCIFPNAEGVLNVDAESQRRMIDEMRNGQFLIIDSIKFNVIFDDFIVEESSSDTSNLTEGQFASDIYFIPLTVKGGTPVTFMEYLDYGQQVLPQIQDGRLGSYYWSDGGRFLWHAKPPTNWCVQHIAKAEWRVLLTTPQLAGRVTNVGYAPLQHTRDAVQGDAYFVDGGVSGERAAPSLFSDWNLP